MGSDEKKRAKEEAKILKKKLKAQQKIEKAKAKESAKQAKKKDEGSTEVEDSSKEERSSHIVTFAQGVRGVLFLILSISLIVAIVLSNRGYIITLDEIFESLVAIWIGKVVLVVLSIAFFVIGLKQLKAIK